MNPGEPVSQNRQFVDLNRKEVAIGEFICMETGLNGVSSEMDWSEIKSDVKPVPSMDNIEETEPSEFYRKRERKLELCETEPKS